MKTFGLVASVNGSTADGACGVAVPGTFTVVARNTSQTIVHVSSSTKFQGRHLTNPTFANVCVNEIVGAEGTASGGVFNATHVKIWSPKGPHPVSAFGLVISVNGSTADGACGTGTSGTFTLMSRNTSQTIVNVTSSTLIFGRGLTAPTFVNVCVDKMVGATGTVSGSAIAATDVMIWSPVPTDFNTFGMVISVNGSTASTACGVGTSGTFTVLRRNASQTIVDVTAATTFTQKGVSSPSFANVCVNEMTGSHGTVSGGVFNADKVHIWSRPGLPWATAFGMVISVNGSTASTACGVGTSGTFTVLRRNASRTVINVTAATKFREKDVSPVSFANVCVNEVVHAAGTVSGAVLNANRVRIWSAPATP